VAKKIQTADGADFADGGADGGKEEQVFWFVFICVIRVIRGYLVFGQYSRRLTRR
jgi:hypothetical protein